ncbi:MAG: DUF3047 domain-containing protein [Burkholderiales bacterium]|nr:DUF3047 domain-containing protein [Burkholderiales bacterium]
MKTAVLAVLTLAAALAGCAAPGLGEPQAAVSAAPRAAPPTDVLAPFSGIDRLDPKGPWATWIFHPTKKPTRFRSVTVDGVRVVEAQSEQSISGLQHRVDVDPGERPILEWRWRVDRVLETANMRERHGDDSPVRVVLAFEGDVSSLPIKEQMFFERVKLLGGQDMPYATLMYVWCNASEAEAVTPNAHTSRVQKIVVESGAQGVGQWRSYRRDIVADYERAFGRKPGRLVAVGVLSDTDNTRLSARGWYGDIRLLSRAE